MLSAFRAACLVAAAETRPVAAAIRRKLTDELQPTLLEVIDDSARHSRRGGGPSDETHFKVKIVSKAFGKDTLVKRHQKIYSILDDELNGGVKAVALQTRTPQEYAKLGWEWRAK